MRRVMGPSSDKIDGYFAGSQLAAVANKAICAHYGGRASWPGAVSGAQTALKHGPFDIVQNAGAGSPTITETGAGLLVTTETSDNGTTIIQTAKQVTPAANQVFCAEVRMQDSNLDNNVLFGFGIRNNDFLANIATAATITDCVVWSHALNATDGIFTPRVRGNEGTIADGTALSAITAARDYVLGMKFMPHATVPWGHFYYSLGTASGMDGNQALTVVPFTTAQLTQLAAWLTTPATTVIGLLQMRNSTANSRTHTIQYLSFEVDRMS